MTLLKAELSLEVNFCLGSSGVEQSPEKACVGGANPSRGTTKYLEINIKEINFYSIINDKRTTKNEYNTGKSKVV